jgi:hypothetical protein
MYMGAPGTSLNDWPEGWELVNVPSGSDSLQITFTIKNGDVVKLLGEVVNERISDAACFDEWVRESHRLPDVKDVKLLRSLNVTGFGMRLTGSGGYKVVYFDFKDESSYEHGKVYE